MDLGEAFCIVCGSPPPLFGERMCEKCFRKRNILAEIPTNVNWSRCPRCDLTSLSGRWIEIADEELWHELVESNMKLHPEAEGISVGLETRKVDDRNTLIYLQIGGVISGLEYEEEHQMRARKSNAVCLTCSRRDGNYLEATVQLRSSARKLADEEYTVLRATLDSLIANLERDPMFFVTKEGPVTGGYDVVLGSKGLAKSWGRQLVSQFGGQITTTSSVIGRKDGLDVSRMTLLYRKPGYDLGDVVRWREELWRIASWSGEGAILSKVERKERTGATWRDLEYATVVSRMQDHLILETVTEDATVGEFLNPNNWQMDAVRLAYDHVVGSKLRLARIEGEWVALPLQQVDVKS